MKRGRLLSIGQAADVLGVSERMIVRLYEGRRLPYVRLGRHIRFAESDLEDLVEQSRTEPPPGREIQR